MTTPQEANMTTLQEAARKALACLELYDHEDLASCEERHGLRTALAQQATLVPQEWTNLLAYALQDDMHNRLTPRVVDIAYTAFTSAKRTYSEDGGASDWFHDTKPKVTELIAKLRKDLIEEFAAAPAPQVKEPTAWRTEALKWIRRKAEDQRATNEQNPRHAEAYPSWGERVRNWHWLADELELEQNSTSFGLEPYQEPAPQPAPKGEPVMFAWKRDDDGTYYDASGTEHSCGMHPLFAHAEPVPQPAQGEPTGCACRWDADDNRVATCARHLGWLDVVHEWAERAKAAEAALQSTQPEPLDLTEDEWTALAINHASADWGSQKPDGFLNSVKALCSEYAALQSAGECCNKCGATSW